MIEPAEAILRDGTSISIRVVGPDDRAGLIALFGRMGPLSVRHRFFAAKHELTEADLSYPASDTYVVLAATVIQPCSIAAPVPSR